MNFRETDNEEPDSPGLPFLVSHFGFLQGFVSIIGTSEILISPCSGLKSKQKIISEILTSMGIGDGEGDIACRSAPHGPGAGPALDAPDLPSTPCNAIFHEIYLRRTESVGFPKRA